MAEFTLLKLQFDDASFTANAPLSGEGDESEGDAETDDSDSSPSILPFFVGLLFLLVLGVAAKKVLGGSDDDVESLESHDD